MSIKSWPESERPRERLIRYGSRTLTDGEIVALLIGSGTACVDALTLARCLLAEHGSLRLLLDCQPANLLRHDGIGWAGYCRLQAGLELGRRFLAAPARGNQPMSDPARASTYLEARLGGLGHELFCCLFLDSRHRLICCEDLFRGTVDGAVVYPREVVKRALHHNAAGVILGHNHPSGAPEPSASDRDMTLRLKQALALIDVTVLDHLIVGAGSSVSLARRGWL